MANSQGEGKLLETSCGSPHYASPEIIKGLQYNGNESDIWSCGVILYALLTGNLPFDDENVRKLLGKVKAGIFSIPSYVNPDAQQLIRQMLTVDSKYRISMQNVKKHPWFLSRPARKSQESDEEYLNNEEPIYCIENDIIEQMHTLGYDMVDTRTVLSETGYVSV